jgi:hypothetical protein
MTKTKECYSTVIDPWLKESKGMAQRQILVSALVRRIVMVARSLRREIPALSWTNNIIFGLILSDTLDENQIRYLVGYSEMNLNILKIQYVVGDLNLFWKKERERVMQLTAAGRRVVFIYS